MYAGGGGGLNPPLILDGGLNTCQPPLIFIRGGWLQCIVYVFLSIYIEILKIVL